MYYGYVRRLGGHSFLGFCVLQNGLLFRDIEGAFNAFEQTFADAVTRGKIVRFSENGEVVSNPDIVSLESCRKEVENIETALNLRFRQLLGTLSKLPPVKFASDDNEVKRFELTDNKEEIIQSFLSNGYTYIYKESGDNASMRSYQHTLRSLSTDNAAKDDEIRRLQAENEKLKSANTKYERRQKKVDAEKAAKRQEDKARRKEQLNNLGSGIVSVLLFPFRVIWIIISGLFYVIWQLWPTLLCGAIAYLCFHYCYVHDFTYEHMSDGWLVGEHTTTQWHWKWLGIGILYVIFCVLTGGLLGYTIASEGQESDAADRGSACGCLGSLLLPLALLFLLPDRPFQFIDKEHQYVGKVKDIGEMEMNLTFSSSGDIAGTFVNLIDKSLKTPVEGKYQDDQFIIYADGHLWEGTISDEGKHLYGHLKGGETDGEKQDDYLFSVNTD